MKITHTDSDIIIEDSFQNLSAVGDILKHIKTTLEQGEGRIVIRVRNKKILVDKINTYKIGEYL